MPGRRSAGALVLAAFVTLVASCGDDVGAADRPADGDRATVFAAASLTEVFEELGGARYSFGGSQALATQIEQGAPADVIATADERTVARLAEAGLTDEPVVFARNRLALVVEAGNPRGVRSLADLARDDLVVVLADPSVPVGAYSRQVLERARVEVQPASLELDVKAVLAKVTSGDADVGIVYDTDTDTETGIAIPDEQNVSTSYHLAVVRSAPHPEAARAFVRRVQGDEGQAILRRRGFLAP